MALLENWNWAVYISIAAKRKSLISLHLTLFKINKKSILVGGLPPTQNNQHDTKQTHCTVSTYGVNFELSILNASFFSSRPRDGFFHPTLYQNTYELEDGSTPDGEPVRAGFSDETFPGFSLTGYAQFSIVQVWYRK